MSLNLSCCLCFGLALSLSCCSLSAQTTEEEYRYVTYGYQEQLEKGLDDKKGYSWKPCFSTILSITTKK
ncbi:MAG: hypothetical protein HC821_03880 [Lewinella sp.]|nr:hypothetical protein [Lewinella sp.]